MRSRAHGNRSTRGTSATTAALPRIPSVVCLQPCVPVESPIYFLIARALGYPRPLALPLPVFIRPHFRPSFFALRGGNIQISNRPHTTRGFIPSSSIIGWGVVSCVLLRIVPGAGRQRCPLSRTSPRCYLAKPSRRTRLSSRVSQSASVSSILCLLFPPPPPTSPLGPHTLIHGRAAALDSGPSFPRLIPRSLVSTCPSALGLQLVPFNAHCQVSIGSKVTSLETATVENNVTSCMLPYQRCLWWHARWPFAASPARHSLLVHAVTCSLPVPWYLPSTSLCGTPQTRRL